MQVVEGRCLGCRFALNLDGSADWTDLLVLPFAGPRHVPAGPDLGVWNVRTTRNGFSVTSDHTPAAAVTTAEAAVAHATSSIELFAAAHTTAFVVVHAAVVEYEGRALVLPGRSRAGKSTLAAALVAAGAVYHSDEYALLDEHGRVHPYARPLRLRTAEGFSQRPVEDFGGREASAPAPVGLVAALQFAGTQAGWNVQSMSPGETALAMIDNAVGATVDPVRVVDWAAAAALGAYGIKGWRGAAGGAASRLLDMLR